MAALLVTLSCEQRPVICLDPGHTSENGSGTRGKKLTELGVAWRVACLLKPLLEADGYDVVLTKTSQGEKVTNRQRADIANKAGAALLLRLHCDAGSGTGFASYYPSQQGKNGKDRGPSADVIRASSAAIRKFHPAVAKVLIGKLRDAGLKTDLQTKIGGQQGALTGSIMSHVPVILVEMCVLMNSHDEAFLLNGGEKTLAEALQAGVRAAVPRG